jgi:microcompartment protein CcmL/EutN
MSALAFIEVPFFSIAAVVADTVAKASGVRILGFDTSGSEEIVIRVAGGVAELTDALEAAETCARKLGVKYLGTRLARPDIQYADLYSAPNAINPLYGGRDQFLPTDFPNPDPSMKTESHALGILETQGLTAILEATDAMLKSADVQLVGKEKIGAAYVTIVVRGDVAAVTAAVAAGAAAAAPLGKVIASHVIARPHAELIALLPK